MKKKILFICEKNSARSQIAEALVNKFYGDKYEAYSAGVKPGEINPYVIVALNDYGIDISSKEAKGVDRFLNQSFDYVVTVCDAAKETCPIFYGGKIYLHKNFVEPIMQDNNEEKIIEQYRELIGEIKQWIEKEFGNK